MRSRYRCGARLVRGQGHLIVKLLVLVAVPAGVVTLTRPVVAPAGTSPGSRWLNSP